MGTNTSRRRSIFRRSLADQDTTRTPSHNSDSSSNMPDTPTPSNTRRNSRRRSSLSAFLTLHRTTPNIRNERPTISRPILNQGDIEVRGPFIYNHPTRPRLDVEIPRSSFSDLWGQRYGPDTTIPDFVDDGSEINVLDLNGEVEQEVNSMHRDGEEGDEEEDGDEVVEAESRAPSILHSATPSPSPASTPLPPSPASSTAAPLEQELSARWLRHPLRQNPPPVPPPSPAASAPLDLEGFRPSCGITVKLHQRPPAGPRRRSFCCGLFTRRRRVQTPVVEVVEEEEEERPGRGVRESWVTVSRWFE